MSNDPLGHEMEKDENIGLARKLGTATRRGISYANTP